jgi:hypothetical protein
MPIAPVSETFAISTILQEALATRTGKNFLTPSKIIPTPNALL